MVTTKDADGNLHRDHCLGVLFGFLEPPMVLICIEKTTASHYAFEESEIFVVNILSETQAAVSEQFAAPY